ncbi:MAG: sugar phosphate isomerase/epimerase [Candidatus Omnitrophica bacterium]|nr:sugar phosphate isomerase/epimerase [Candidatus Omnitrophota bacterium]
MATRTGNYPIGFRRGWGWQDDTKKIAGFAKDNGFASIDLGGATDEDIKILRDHGLGIGSCDLLDMGLLLSDDESERKSVTEKNKEYIQKLAENDLHLLFTAVIPKNKENSRQQNYDLALKTLGELANVAHKVGSQIVIEGWPGPPPHFANLCCNPETYRKIIQDIGKSGIGVNYDPSHLIRMGIDHIKFLEEFLPHVGHVHGKDTEVFPEAVYEYGYNQLPAFTEIPNFGEGYWRYTIPGHGETRWTKVFEILEGASWKGIVSIELEDDNFRGNEEIEKLGYLNSKLFLETA